MGFMMRVFANAMAILVAAAVAPGIELRGTGRPAKWVTARPRSYLKAGYPVTRAR